MMIYNQAFDLYHTIYRILLLLNKFEESTLIEIDRIRIWDFYLLFPEKVYDIRIKRSEKDIRNLRKQYIKKTDNPYNQISNKRKIFEKIKPYQIAAINSIASYGMIDKDLLSNNRISIISKETIINYIRTCEVSPIENNTISLLSLYFSNISLFGSDGLKNRTNLMESKYDVQ